MNTVTAVSSGLANTRKEATTAKAHAQWRRFIFQKKWRLDPVRDPSHDLFNRSGHSPGSKLVWFGCNHTGPRAHRPGSIDYQLKKESCGQSS